MATFLTISSRTVTNRDMVHCATGKFILAYFIVCSHAIDGFRARKAIHVRLATLCERFEQRIHIEAITIVPSSAFVRARTEKPIKFFR